MAEKNISRKGAEIAKEKNRKGYATGPTCCIGPIGEMTPSVLRQYVADKIILWRQKAKYAGKSACPMSPRQTM